MLMRKLPSTLDRHLLLRLSTCRRLSSSAPVDPSHLLQVCTVLFQHRNSPDPKLHSALRSIPVRLSHELFLCVCDTFSSSWKPVHRFYLFSLLHAPSFPHTPTSLNKLLSVLASAANVPLLWDVLAHASDALLADRRSYLIAARAFAEGRQIRKLVGVLDLVKRRDAESYDTGTLNLVVRELCGRRLVEEARELVRKIRAEIAPDGETYGYLVVGLCRKGDLAGAGKIWNAMIDGGMAPGVEVYEELIVTFFKGNRVEDAMGVFKSLRSAMFCEMGTSSYEIVITWLCKEGRIVCALMVFDEMLKRGVGVDGRTLGALAYGFLARRKVRAAYMVLDGADRPDIFVYHGLIRGLLRLRRAGDAVEVFREMIRRGCEPIMHTYVMLLQGLLGRRGRKARDPLVNFDSIFVGGLVKVGKYLEATKYVERMMHASTEVPRFDYNKFLHCFSNEEGVVMFEEVGKRLKEVELVDLGDVFMRYGEKMATRDRRRRLPGSEF